MELSHSQLNLPDSKPITRSQVVDALSAGAQGYGVADPGVMIQRDATSFHVRSNVFVSCVTVSGQDRVVSQT